MQKPDAVLGFLTIVALTGIFPTTGALTLSNISIAKGIGMPTNFTGNISDLANSIMTWTVNSRYAVNATIAAVNGTASVSDIVIADDSMYEPPIAETKTTAATTTIMAASTTKQTTSKSQTTTATIQGISPSATSTNVTSSAAVTSTSNVPSDATASSSSYGKDCGEHGTVCNGATRTFRCSRKLGKTEDCVVTWKCYILIPPEFTSMRPMGTLIFWNGTLAPPNGTFIPPNATLTLPNGTFISPNVTLTLPNDTLISPTGILITPNGTLVYPNGTLISQNGTLREPSYICDGKSACNPGVWGPTCNKACGVGCDTLGNSALHICDVVTGRCVSNLTGALKTDCLAGWRGERCQNPICDESCNGGTCLAPNYCGNCPSRFEGGRTCRNVSLDGFAKGSIPSLAILSAIIFLLRLGSQWYDNTKNKAD